MTWSYVDYMPTIWAVQTLGGIVTQVWPKSLRNQESNALLRPSNPSYNIEELVYQLKTTNAKLVIAHPLCLGTAAAAASAVGLSTTSIVSLGREQGNYVTLEELIPFGASRPENYKAIRLKPGEGRTKLAFLCLSSGTTGMHGILRGDSITDNQA